MKIPADEKLLILQSLGEIAENLDQIIRSSRQFSPKEEHPPFSVAVERIRNFIIYERENLSKLIYKNYLINKKIMKAK